MKNQYFFAYSGIVAALFLAYILLTSGSALQPLASFFTPEGMLVVHQIPLPASVSFAGETTSLENSDVRESIDYELTAIAYRHAYTSAILKNANRFFPLIEDILRKNGVPDDFKYVAISESGLENTTSPKQAKGVWQFMEGTARQYGLEVSDDVDERYNLEKATAAACKYFKDAYGKFNNWTLAAASYNCGMGSMQESVNQQQAWNYHDMAFNLETGRYMYKTMAYKVLMSNPSAYGFNLSPSDLYAPWATKTVSVTSIPDIANFAREHKTTYRKIKLLNPWLKKSTLSAKFGKTYDVKVPL
jgi:membrane-bound lytic murein transglycosylase D